MRCYVAAPLAEVGMACIIATALRRAGHDITSTWHAVVQAGDVDPAEPRTRQDILAVNLADLIRCEVVVAWTASGTPRATLCEVAYALARGKRVVWIQGADGQGANLFDADPAVTILREHTEAAMLAALTLRAA